MRDANAFGFNLPEVPGLGITAGVEIDLQNRNGQDIREFAQREAGVRQAVTSSRRRWLRPEASGPTFRRCS